MSFSQNTSMSARALLDRHWDAALPVRPVALASSAGLLVFRRADFSAVAGIERDVNGRPVIMLGSAPDSEQAKLRERFAIAHALGHIALSHFGPGDLPHQDVASHFSLNATSPIERAANDFAMALLMPEDALEVILRDRRSISEIASIFVVSEVALQQRLIDLGMLPRKGAPLRM